MLPFEKLKVLDFSQRLPGPYCSSILADMGAEVVMVERAGTPPETRDVFPGLFQLINKNKRSMTLNIKHEEGKAILVRLMEQADVVIEESRPGVAARLGYGYEDARRVNPKVVYCSISGFGQDGPYRDRVGHDINYLSLSGILSIPGQLDAPPSRPGIPLVDLASGMFAAISIMAALRKRDSEGTGDYVDISMFDAMISWMSLRAGSFLVYGEKIRNEHLSPLNSIYETRDGKKISLGMIEQHFWENFCHACEREDLLVDPRFSSPSARKIHSEHLLHALREIISGKDLDEWDALLDWAKIPYAPVHTPEEAIYDLHVKARGIFQEIQVEGLGTVKEILFPAKFQGFQATVRRPPPRWGQHTEEVLGELGWSAAEVAKLRGKKII